MKKKLNPLVMRLQAIWGWEVSVASNNNKNNNTESAPLFVDLNEVPMHEIDLLFLFKFGLPFAVSLSLAYSLAFVSSIAEHIYIASILFLFQNLKPGVLL
jgi:hypothetical protein